MHWLLVLLGLVLGLIIGVPLLGLATSAQSADLRSRNSVLYGALYNLVRAVEAERLAGCFVEVPDTPIYEALDAAREALELPQC